MILSTKKRFIFVHNPKTGGTSIRRALAKEIRPIEQSLLYKIIRRIGDFAYRYPFYDFLNRPHTTLYQASLLIPQSIFAQCYKFGIVRNPYEWALSIYRHYLSYCHKYPEKNMLVKRDINSFSEFALRLHDLNLIPYQSYAFINPKGEFLGDSLGFFGSLKQYCSFLKSSINVEFNLQHLNRNIMDKKFYLSDFDKKIIEEIWNYDFEFFCDFNIDVNGQVLLNKSEPKVVPIKTLEDYDCWYFFRDK